MSKFRRVLSAIAIVAALGAAAAIWALESDLAKFRSHSASAEPHWSCTSLPPDATLARVYARQVIWWDGTHPTGLAWHAKYTAYTLYYGWRVPRDELAESYLRTPSSREKNCIPISGVRA
jgi:hypothetical protein